MRSPCSVKPSLPCLSPSSGSFSRLPMATIPQHDRPPAILLRRNDPLEFAIGQRVVLGSDRETLFGCVEARAARDRPAEQYPIPFEPEVEMQAGRIVLLHHEGTASRPLLSPRARPAARASAKSRACRDIRRAACRPCSRCAPRRGMQQSPPGWTERHDGTLPNRLRTHAPESTGATEGSGSAPRSCRFP